MLKTYLKYSLLILLCQSCATTNYQGVYELEVPKVYEASKKLNSFSVENPELKRTRKVFIQDAMLNTIIDSVLSKNYNLLIALKNIEKFEQRVKQSKAANIPTLQLAVAASRNDFSDNSLNGSQGFNLENSLGKDYVEDYLAEIGLNWEPDIWLKNKNSKKAAIARWLKEQEVLKKLKIDLVQKTVNVYYDVLLIESKLDIANKNLALSDSIYKTVKLKKEFGYGNELEVQQAQLQVLEIQDFLQVLANKKTLLNNVLSILLSETSHSFKIQGNLKDFRFNENLYLGTPNELLTNNPSVRENVLNLEQSRYLSEKASSNRYPNLNIGLAAGLNSFQSGNWFSLPGSFFNTIASSVTQPVLNGRKLKTEYEISKIEVDQSILAVNEKLLNTTVEVSTKLNIYNRVKKSLENNTKELNVLEKAIMNASLLYEEGEIDYVQVLLVQQNLLNTQIKSLDFQKDLIDTYISIYTLIGFDI